MNLLQYQIIVVQICFNQISRILEKESNQMTGLILESHIRVSLVINATLIP